MTDDPYHLQRFIDAQAAQYGCVTQELRAGRKRTHWMWFVFPQIDGLAFSETSRFFALRSPDEARAYLAQPVLGARLRECTRLAIQAEQPTDALFGYPDDRKFQSCMTLFDLAAPAEPLFADAIDRLCGGVRDERTVQIVEALAVGTKQI